MPWDDNLLCFVMENPDYLISISMREGLSFEDARDTAQETLLKSLVTNSYSEGKGSIKGWLYRICVNECRNYFRKNKNEPDAYGTKLSIFDDEDKLDFLAERGNEENIYGMIRDIVNDGMSELDENLREIIRMKYWENMSYNEIASVTGIPKGTVKSRLNSARKCLKQNILNSEFRELFRDI